MEEMTPIDLQHAQICRCGFDICACPCSKCQANRDRQHYFKRLSDTFEQVLAAGINPNDLTELMQFFIEDGIRKYIDAALARQAEEHVDRLLKRPDLREKLADLLFEEMFDVAYSVQQGVKRNGRNKSGAGGTNGRGKEAGGGEEQTAVAKRR